MGEACAEEFGLLPQTVYLPELIEVVKQNMPNRKCNPYPNTDLLKLHTYTVFKPLANGL